MLLLRKELAIFFAALTFLTRLPAPSWVNFTPEYLNLAARYFPLVGLLIGAIAAVLIGWLTPIYGQLSAVLLSTAATVVLTGAFHEDGFADFCDGFGGGWNKEQIITIMKDSRLGTFGALGIGLLLSIKIQMLSTIDAASLPLVLLTGHASSRAVAISYLANYRYVQDDEASKVKPLATSISSPALLFALACGLLPLACLSFGQFLSVLLVLIVLRQCFGYYLKRWLGGYTGDCLGASQQLSEVAIYLVLSAMLST